MHRELTRKSFMSFSNAMCRRMVAIACAACCCCDTFAADTIPLTGPRLLSRISRQPLESRPDLFDSTRAEGKTELALVVDGTTSMKQELFDLPLFLGEIAKLFSHDQPENLRIAVVIYRDSRSPSGNVTVVSDFTEDVAGVAEKLRSVKPETGEPYFPEGMDQGLATALEKLKWSDGSSEVEKRILILGDAPPYTDEHENRKHRDEELNRLVVKQKVRIDALLVNSGFPLSEGGEVGTSRESATKAAPYAREFLSSLSNKTSGVFLDLWNEKEIEKLQEPVVVLTDLAPLPTADPLTAPTLEVWRNSLAKHLSSVRAERPALSGLGAFVELQPEKSGSQSLLPVIWPGKAVEGILDELETAVAEEPENAVLHLVTANMHALLATADAYDDHSQAILRHVVAAHAGLKETLPAAVRDEIEGLYALHVMGDGAVAAKSFGKLSTSAAEGENPGCRQRAAWTRLALGLGFWPAGVPAAKGAVNTAECRDIVRDILKHWPESVEGQALKQLIDQSLGHQTEIPRSLFLQPRGH